MAACGTMAECGGWGNAHASPAQRAAAPPPAVNAAVLASGSRGAAPVQRRVASPHARFDVCGGRNTVSASSTPRG
eukprot:NODE_20450_length_798_cov_1.807750.p6 GENE.NODE_20450_length_798_cov_1.807750~~NODE_20450_length_798_cov_1.807750.p6  ORF type:complete len:75 (+),score=21.60 NODE_20450_length_798_cov_1.807750:346-570(+)